MAVERTRSGDVTIVRGGLRPVIEEDQLGHRRAADPAGQLSGAAEGDYEAVLSRRGSTDQHVVGITRDGERFSVEIDVAKMPSFNAADAAAGR